MVDSLSETTSKCLICEKELVWVQERLCYLPNPPRCERFNCPYLDNDNSESDLED
jgi:hypothetical protein